MEARVWGAEHRAAEGDGRMHGRERECVSGTRAQRVGGTDGAMQGQWGKMLHGPGVVVVGVEAALNRN